MESLRLLWAIAVIRLLNVSRSLDAIGCVATLANLQKVTKAYYFQPKSQSGYSIKQLKEQNAYYYK